MILEIGYIFTNKDHIGSCISYFLPELENIVEDFMIFCFSPVQIFNYIINPSEINNLLEKDKEIHGFSFIMD